MKKELANRIGITEKTIQNNIRALQKAADFEGRTEDRRRRLEQQHLPSGRPDCEGK